MYNLLYERRQVLDLVYAEFICRGKQLSKIRLYTETMLTLGSEVELNEEQSRYLGSVMRVSQGDEVFLFDGKNGEFSAQATSVGKKKVSLIVNRKTKDFFCAEDVWLLFAPIKKDRTDFVIEKSTELGVRKIIPTLTRYTISEKVRTDRFRAQVVEASEQSRRLDLPQIEEPQKLEKLLENWDSSRHLFFMDETGEGASAVKTFSQNRGAAALLIGPEGGFAEDELKKLRSCPFAKAVSLGPLILRAETAVAAALSLWQAVNGNWNGDKNEKEG